MFQYNVGVKGRYKIERVHCANTSFEWKEEIVPWFDNLITNTGLDLICSGYSFRTFAQYCHIGTSNVTPNVSQTTLGNLLATTTTLSSNPTYGNYGSPDYIVWNRLTFRFNAGVGTGNISEVGVGSSTVVASRALIVDGLGNPTTITKLSDEILDVTYEFQAKQSLGDFTGNFTLTGDKGGNYSYTGRACNIGSNPTVTNGSMYFLSNNLGITLTNGSLGTILSTPSGDISSGITDIIQQNYITGTYYKEYLYSFGLSLANLSGGITCVYTSAKYLSQFQFQFSPAIPKTSTDALTLMLRIGVGRA